MTREGPVPSCGDVDESAALPEPYAGWMQRALGSPPRVEPNATCHDCAMCRAPDVGVGVGVGVDAPPHLFHPDTKCCTYLPELPNFSVGWILRDADLGEHALRSVRERLEADEATTPLGLEQTDAFRSRYRPHPPEFGGDVALRCPHFEPSSGDCSIWRYRESTCSTWSCKYERGAVGRRFRAALHDLLKETERQLAWWCVEQLGLETDALRALANRSAHDPSAVWGRWSGRREEWCRACADLVDGLEWEDVLRITGPDVATRVRLARAARREHDQVAIPERLRPGTFAVAGRGDSFARVIAYSPFDPIDVPDPLLDLLPRFDGRPTAEVVADIEERTGRRLEDDVLRILVDFGLLES